MQNVIYNNMNLELFLLGKVSRILGNLICIISNRLTLELQFLTKFDENYKNDFSSLKALKCVLL